MKTLFRQALGDTPKIRVLEFLIEGRELDDSICDIAEGAGIGRTSLFRIFEDLLKNDFIKFTRQIGNAKLFKLNVKNAFVKKMIEIFDEVVLPKKVEKIDTGLVKQFRRGLEDVKHRRIKQVA